MGGAFKERRVWLFLKLFYFYLKGAGEVPNSIKGQWFHKLQKSTDNNKRKTTRRARCIEHYQMVPPTNRHQKGTVKGYFTVPQVEMQSEKKD